MTIKRKDFKDVGLTDEGIEIGFKIKEHIELAAEEIRRNDPDISPFDLERTLVRCVTAIVLNQDDVIKWNRQR